MTKKVPDPAQSNEQLVVDVATEDPGWSAVVSHATALSRHVLHRAMARVQACGHMVPGPCEVSILLTDDAGIKTLNERYRGHAKPTNVLSFPAGMPVSGGPTPLGDIIIARETVAREAEAQGKQPSDHLSHMIVHGFLHLLGYDHENNADAQQMESLEISILKELDISNPYAENAA